VTLRLHDSRRGALVPFAQPVDRPVGLYVCGVTPYDTGHLGHAFTYVSFDVLHRYLVHLGYEVRYVQNLTDVDDDMLRKARETGEDYLELGNRWVTTFLTEMAALNWLPPHVYPRATEHIPQMQAMIAALLERGHAYAAEGNVYFDVASWPAYGDVSGLPREAMLPIANERGNIPEMPGKRDPLDFVLWQRSLADEPAWDAPWGAGRPGWHIECSAMSTAYLGNRFAIHGGGGDLIFPHHESEAAQSEAATGEGPFVNTWMHVGMLRHEGEKMSKSLGNLVLVRDLLRSYPGDAIRHFIVSHHYRREVDYDTAGLEASAGIVARLRAAVCRARDLAPQPPALDADASLHPEVAEHRARFLAAMDDDLDTPAALPELHALAALAGGDDVRLASEAGWMVHELGTKIIGLRLAPAGAMDAAAASS
jgi:L-cysteine:1D-myo-inositol 2-amino-2-deoxy-alpha-D-glucopyranoside ligase